MTYVNPDRATSQYYLCAHSALVSTPASSLFLGRASTLVLVGLPITEHLSGLGGLFVFAGAFVFNSKP